LWFALAYSPFFLNDLLFMRITDWRAYLLVDYGARLLVVALLLAPRGLRTVTLRREPMIVDPWRALTLIIGCVALWWLLHTGFDPLLRDVLGDTSLARFPVLPPGIKQFDLFVGIGLVALSEELMSRRCAAHVLRAYLRDDGLVIAVSALLFGAMHWSTGVENVVTCTVIGALLMATYLRTGTLWPVVVAHYVIDVIAFW
jgi:membrane protease YdiL (CAAX protease family)